MDSKNAAPYEAAFFCGFDLERHGAFIDLAFIPLQLSLKASFSSISIRKHSAIVRMCFA
jgi:hypothetical protein